MFGFVRSMLSEMTGALGLLNIPLNHISKTSLRGSSPGSTRALEMEPGWCFQKRGKAMMMLCPPVRDMQLIIMYTSWWLLNYGWKLWLRIPLGETDGIQCLQHVASSIFCRFSSFRLRVDGLVCWVWPTTNEILVDYYYTFRLLLSEPVLDWDYITTASFLFPKASLVLFLFDIYILQEDTFFPHLPPSYEAGIGNVTWY